MPDTLARFLLRKLLLRVELFKPSGVTFEQKTLTSIKYLRMYFSHEIHRTCARTSYFSCAQTLILLLHKIGRVSQRSIEWYSIAGDGKG